MDAGETVKYYRVKGTRTLADGTIKEYHYNKAYKVKNGVNDRRKDGNSGPKEIEFTPEQTAEIWAKHCAGVTIKRICADVNSTYCPVKRCIDRKKAEVPAVIN